MNKEYNATYILFIQASHIATGIVINLHSGFANDWRTQSMG